MPKPNPQRVMVESSTVAGLNVIKNKRDRALLESNIRRMRAINVEMDKLKREKEVLVVDIECTLTENEIKRIEFDGLSTNCYTSSNSQIKKELLLRAGVEPGTILECTVTKPYTVVTVRAVGEKE